MGPGKMARKLRDEGVTVWWAGAEEFEAVAQEFPWGLKGIRLVVCEERMEVLEQLKERLGEEMVERVYGVYGYSEAGGACLMYGVEELGGKGEKKRKGVVKVEHVGRGVRLYLLNAEMEAVGEGELGEIYIGGEGIAESYAGEREESATVFVPDPYAAEEGKRMYRTGDLGWRRADGTLEYRRRDDGRMTIGGVRVEAREVEAVLEEEDRSERGGSGDAGQRNGRGMGSGSGGSDEGGCGATGRRDEAASGGEAADGDGAAADREGGGDSTRRRRESGSRKVGEDIGGDGGEREEGGVCRAEEWDRGAGGGDLGEDVWGGASGDERELFRVGRAFAAGDAGSGADQ